MIACKKDLLIQIFDDILQTMTNEKTTTMLASPSFSRRSMSPSPRRLIDIRKKQSSLEAQPTNVQDEPPLVNEAKVESNTNGTNDGANKYENISDNGSEISDEGYRSLGLIQSNNAKRISLHSQVSNEDAETNGEKNEIEFIIHMLLILLNYHSNKIGRLDYRNSPEMTTTPTTETSESHKPDSPISDEVVDSMKEIETKFAKSGIVINGDQISVDIAKSTGLRKTGFSEELYAKSRIPKSPMLTRRKSMENCKALADEESLRRSPAYRSVRQPTTAVQKTRTQEKENTWNGRSSISPTHTAKKRPQITQDTFKSPSRTASLTRNTPSRSSQYDSRTRQRSSTRASSVHTSPNKTVNPQSPLAQQFLEAAGKAKNDAEILGKIKQILSDYASKNKIGEPDDFTRTWVNSNGQLDCDVNHRGNSKSPSSKRSSSVSTSSDSNPTPSSIVAPRRSDKGISRIPAPVRSNTGLF